MTYDPQAIFNAVDANMAGYFALGGVALLFNYVYFIGAIVAASRDKVFTFPLFCTTLWFAHDLSFVLAYDEWFHVYHHWYVKGFWAGLIPTMSIEAWYIYQTWLYGKDELLPKASQGAFTGYVLLAVAAGIVGWWSLKAFLDDPIYAYMFGASGLIAPLFVIPRMLKRGDAKGQSVLTWVSYVGMQSCWFAGAITFFGPAFHTPQYLAMAATSVGGGIVAAVMVYRYQKVSSMNQGKLL